MDTEMQFRLQKLENVANIYNLYRLLLSWQPVQSVNNNASNHAALRLNHVNRIHFNDWRTHLDVALIIQLPWPSHLVLSHPLNKIFKATAVPIMKSKVIDWEFNKRCNDCYELRGLTSHDYTTFYSCHKGIYPATKDN